MNTKPIGGIQTLAATNTHLRPCVESALIEVMAGVTRLRMTATTPVVVRFRLRDRGLVADATTEDGEHLGSWAVQIRAL